VQEKISEHFKYDWNMACHICYSNKWKGRDIFCQWKKHAMTPMLRGEMHIVLLKCSYKEKGPWGSAVNFINVLRAHFLYKILAPKITKLKLFRLQWNVSFVIFWRQNICAKFAQKMLMKLTPYKQRISATMCQCVSEKWPSLTWFESLI